MTNLPAIPELTADEARQITDRISVAIGIVWELVIEAYQRRAWTALGYGSWDDYTTREFGSSRLPLPREDRPGVVSSLREAGLSLRAISSATGLAVNTVREALYQTDTMPDRVATTDGRSYPSTRPPRREVVERARETQRAPTPSTVEWDEPERLDDDEVEAIADEIEATWDEQPDQIEDAPSFIDEVVAGCVESKRIPQPQSKPDLGTGVSHPARYSDELLPHFVGLLRDYSRVLDPFAGTGKIFQLRADGHDVVGIELEPEWASSHPDTIVGNALSLPFPDESFDAICTSPTYGNRLADHHNAYDPEARRSYTHDLGRQLHDDNSGAMQWGPEYRQFHEDAWAEAVRVLKPFGRFVLNLKDHIRGGEWQDVLGWHVATLCRLDLEVRAIRPVVTRALRIGDTANLRVDAEMIFAFDKAAQ